ncbi:Methyl-accepting chemotaxis protein PctA [Tepidimonas fonticaldi]|uniref:Methyl-accepting chemotaxis protein PctA n=1 Tax=Tepidimonas fonticaldi TaxID=1101373 RepID=A0A554XJ45_9BURK|nr:Methyl-accepting chemotaxis protein PctA [Tepidimonas fonticaldi]
MFDALRQRAAPSRAPVVDDVPSGLDSTLGEAGSTLGDSTYARPSAAARGDRSARPPAAPAGAARPRATAAEPVEAHQADGAGGPALWLAGLGTLAMAVSAIAPVFAGDALPLPLAWWPALTAGGGALAVAGLAMAWRAQRIRVRQREAELERTRAQALEQQREAKRVNDATQAAILRLMNELQAVAEGDLTQQASVTEDITGAIADSVNYTVEELRTLVAQVQAAAQRVAETTARVENTSIELLAASTEQLREIRETGQSVLDMSGRITEVAAQAQASADAARQARAAAESGARAVQETIGGMSTIREQIQDTARRIKRLGESSQEIGEITDLIADITEQTNVLALNAAIQAASAGEAGRGFSVVAEEVQRLAERSADATRQIAALVRAIQADTQDAVLAMERSTREVVEGARLSDNAGAALAEIDRLSRQAAELVEQIAGSAGREAALAGQTATSIQHILGVTEQTGEGTRSTVQQVRELARVADELRQSVARFKIR